MSCTIINHDKNAPDLLPNISAWNVYGIISALAGIPCIFPLGAFIEYDDLLALANPPESASKTQSKDWAKRIRFGFLNEKENAGMKIRYQILSKHTKLKGQDLREFIEEYCDWLEKCGGYHLV